MDFTHPPTPIASLSPSLTSSKVDNASHPWFVGSIRLVWPYISGNGTPQITFLLADTDVLKRAERGQVRVRIVKKLAAEVKNSGAHIGDELSLPLEDVSWVEEDEERKGGRWVGWVVEIGERGGKCKVKKQDGSVLFVKVSEDDAELKPTSPTTFAPSIRERSTTITGTPEVSIPSSPESQHTSQPQTPKYRIPTAALGTPRSVAGKRTWMETDLDAILFDELDEDGEVERKPKRARYSTNWTLDKTQEVKAKIALEKEEPVKSEPAEPEKLISADPRVALEDKLKSETGEDTHMDGAHHEDDKEVGKDGKTDGFKEAKHAQEQEKKDQSDEPTIALGRRPSIIATVTTTVDQIETHIPETVTEVKDAEEGEGPLPKAQIETHITAEAEEDRKEGVLKEEYSEMGEIEGSVSKDEEVTVAQLKYEADVKDERKEKTREATDDQSVKAKPETSTKNLVEQNQQSPKQTQQSKGSPTKALSFKTGEKLRIQTGPETKLENEPSDQSKVNAFFGMFGGLGGIAPRRPSQTSLPTEPESPQLRPMDSPKSLMSPFVSGSLEGPSNRNNGNGGFDSRRPSISWTSGNSNKPPAIPSVPSNLSKLSKLSTSDAPVKSPASPTPSGHSAVIDLTGSSDEDDDGKEESNPSPTAAKSSSLFNSPASCKSTSQSTKKTPIPLSPAQAREQEQRDFKLNAFFGGIGPSKSLQISPTSSRHSRNSQANVADQTPKQRRLSSGSTTSSEGPMSASSQMSPEQKREILMKYAPIIRTGSRQSNRSFEDLPSTPKREMERSGKLSPEERAEALAKYTPIIRSGSSSKKRKEEEEATPETPSCPARKKIDTLTPLNTDSSTAHSGEDEPPKTPIYKTSITPGTPGSRASLKSGNSLMVPNTPPKAIGSFSSGIITPRSEFPAIATLAYNQIPDILAIVTRSSAPTRSTKGTKDWILSFRCLDSSSLKGIAVKLFRRSKDDFPDFSSDDSEAVTGVLLRGFKVESQQRELRLVGNPRSSGWVVWKGLKPGRLGDQENGGEKVEGEVGRVPVEYGKEEEEYVMRLARWFFEELSSDTRGSLRRVRHGNV